jgi:hypothetical protein
MSEVSITVSGEHAQRVTPELCDVSLSVQADSVDANEAVDKVTTTTNRISAILRELAPKAEVSSAVLDLEPPIVPDLPVTKWSVQRLQKYSRSNRVEDSRSEGEVPAVRGGPAARAFSTTTTYRNETRTYVSTSVNATFHDFKKLEEFVNTVTVSTYVGC